MLIEERLDPLLGLRYDERMMPDNQNRSTQPGAGEELNMVGSRRGVMDGRRNIDAQRSRHTPLVRMAFGVGMEDCTMALVRRAWVTGSRVLPKHNCPLVAAI